MLQGYLLVTHLWLSTGAIFILFIAATLLLINPLKDGLNEYNTPVILSISILILVLLSLIFSQFVVDDVFITLRYARNLANGHGLVFSTDGSQPVEGYTNFLWTVMEAWFFLLGIAENQIVPLIRVTGVLFGAGVIILTYFLMRLLDFDKRISQTAVLFLSVVPELSFWAVGGLETTMYMFWLLLALYRFIYEKKTGLMHTWSMVFLFLLALTRPEGLFFTIAVIVCDVLQTVLVRRKGPPELRRYLRQIVPGVALFIALYAIYFLWRFNFYGYLFPNTYYAKKLSYLEQVFHRVKQVSSFIIPLLPFFAVACLGFFQFHKRFTREKQLLLVMLLVLISFCFVSRNEWMPGYRYELPFVPLLMVFFAAGMGKIVFGNLKEGTTMAQTKVISFVMLFFFGMFIMLRFNNLRKEGDNLSKQLHRAHVPLGKWLKVHAPENASYASWDMGAVPYYSGLPGIIDINTEGLLNTHTTLKGYDVDHVFDQNPSFLVLPPNTSYVRPREILDFYSNEKLDKNYEFLFSITFDRDYILYVYKHRDIVLSDVALEEGKNIADQSRMNLD